MTSFLQWPDYLILVSFLVISLAIGVYHSLTGGRQKTTSEFIMADRRLRVLPTAISLFVSYQSAIGMLGETAELYCYGIQYFIFFTIAQVLAVIIVERVIVPWLYPLKLVSVYEYLERRFMSKAVHLYGSILGITIGVLVMGVLMYAPSVALESATGLPLKVSIPVMATVAIATTALGGMRAVIWTDVFQFLIMMGGIFAILIKGLIVVGGISNVFHLAGQESRLISVSVNPDPRERHTLWGMLIGFTMHWTGIFGLTQSSVQRFSAVNKMSKARLIMLLNIPPLFVIHAMYFIIGLIVLAYFAAIKCDPLANKDIHNPNQLLPYFVFKIFSDSPGFGGLFLATLYGGALSSVSSSLSGAAANAWDCLLKLKMENLAESRKALISRLLVVVLGALAMVVAFFVASVPGPVTQMLSSLSGSISGSLVALFVLGGISKHANWKGCLFGGCLGLLFGLWLSLGSLTLPRKNPPLPPVPIEGCKGDGLNLTMEPLKDNHPSFDVFHELNTEVWNKTIEYLPEDGISRHFMDELRGLENFYAVSYVWFMPFGFLVTSLTGFLASLAMRDKSLREKIDNRLLLRFRNCGCHEETTESDCTEEKPPCDMESERMTEAENEFVTKETLSPDRNGTQLL